MLRATGDYTGPQHGEFDAATRTALRALVGRENLEERWDGTADAIDGLALDYLRRRFG